MASSRRVRLCALGLLLAAAAAVPLAAGCRLYPKPTDTVPDEVRAAHWVEPTNPPTNYTPADPPTVENLAAALVTNSPPRTPAAPPRPLNVVALSAGGKYGAYSAGVLAGWTRSGTRPQFDVVTGVSAGVIVAIYAFLGPQYDPALERFFTQTEDTDLYRYRYVRNLLRYGSIATPDGLVGIIERELNRCVMDELRAAHAAGRRLFVATLNQRTKRLCVWDLGAVASSGRPDADALVRKIVLASVSVPAQVPAVSFDVEVDGRRYTEVHADAGAATQAFVRLPSDPPAVPGTKWLTGSNLYVISAGKLFADPAPSELKLLTRLGANLSSALYALYRAELFRLYTIATTAGMSFNMVLLSESFRGDPSSFRIDPAEMTRLYRVGFEQAQGGVPWRHLPPGAVPGEEDTPRGGTTFVTVPARSER
jgi:hypothetical protein